MSIVDDFPAIAKALRGDRWWEPAKPAVEEPPVSTIYGHLRCFACRQTYEWPKYSYCPNCGEAP